MGLKIGSSPQIWDITPFEPSCSIWTGTILSEQWKMENTKQWCEMCILCGCAVRSLHCYYPEAWKACHGENRVEPTYIHLLRCPFLHAKHMAEHCLMYRTARHCASCKWTLESRLPQLAASSREASRGKFTRGIFTRSGRKRKIILLWICNNSQVQNLFRLPWQRWWSWGVNVKHFYMLPAGLSWSAWAAQAACCKVSLSKTKK